MTWRRLLVFLLSGLLTQSCREQTDRSADRRSSSDAASQTEADATELRPARDAGNPELAADGGAQDCQAPPGTISAEKVVDSGAHALTLGEGDTWGPPLRVDAKTAEHVSFRLDLASAKADVDMEVLAWGKAGVQSLGLTNWGFGFRVLSAFDPYGPRTFWVRARGTEQRGTMTIDRTLIEEGPDCRDDCDRLLQLPLPIDSIRQGYEIAPGSVYAYQFGRRELLMALFEAGSLIAQAKVPPFEVKRISRWDGGQPPSHRSHTNGVDVDISLYNSTGEPVWHPLCMNDGDRCVPGTSWSFGGEQMALLISGFFESELFATREGAAVFLDREFHREVRTGADELLEQGRIAHDVHALFAPEKHLLQHVEPHHHHIHIRIDDCRDSTGAGIPSTFRFRLSE